MKYPHSCRVSPADRAKSFKKKEEPKLRTEWHAARGIHDKSIKCCCDFIEDYIITKEEVHQIQDMHQQYITCLKEFVLESKIEVNRDNYRLEKVEQKNLRHFGDRIKIMDHSIKAIGKVIFKSTMAVKLAFRKALDEDKSLAVQVRHRLSPEFLDKRF